MLEQGILNGIVIINKETNYTLVASTRKSFRKKKLKKVVVVSDKDKIKTV